MAGTEESRGSGYEERDVSLRALWRPMLALVFLVVGSFVAMIGLLGGLEAWRQPEPEDPTRAALRHEHQEIVPSVPRLQREPRKDLETLRAEAERVLHSYGWVNEAEGTVRIPIERAMDLLAERGLPHREGRGHASASGAGEGS